MPSSKQAPWEVGIIRGTERREAVSVPTQHQVSTRDKLKPKTKEFNITTHESENLGNHLNTHI